MIWTYMYMYCSIYGTAPPYLSELIIPYNSSRAGLRSAGQYILTKPRSLGETDLFNTQVLQTSLKTHLLVVAYNSTIFKFIIIIIGELRSCVSQYNTNFRPACRPRSVKMLTFLFWVCFLVELFWVCKSPNEIVILASPFG